MSQRSTSCWIRRCNRQYIFLPQSTLVTCCWARDEKFLSWTRYASSICDRRELSLFTASTAAGPEPRGADDRPNSLKKRDKQERSFSPRKAHNERTPFPREQSARALSPNTQVVCHLVSETLTRIGTPPKAFHNTHTSERKSPEEKKEDDVFHRCPFYARRRSLACVIGVHLPMSSALGVCNHASRHAEGVPKATPRGRSVEVPFGREQQYLIWAEH